MIKKQQVPLSEIIDRAEELAEDLEDARQGTRLPLHPDVGKVDIVGFEECGLRVVVAFDRRQTTASGRGEPRGGRMPYPRM